MVMHGLINSRIVGSIPCEIPILNKNVHQRAALSPPSKCLARDFPGLTACIAGHRLEHGDASCALYGLYRISALSILLGLDSKRMFFIGVHFNGRDIIPHHYNTPRDPNMGIIDHLGGYQLTDIFVVNS
jgi:hypothetical protein